MRALTLPRGDWALIIAGAVLTTLAYPPFHLFLPSFICLATAVWLIQSGAADPRPLRRHLVQGFWFGLLANGFVLYWMVFALWRFTPVSALGYAATILVLAAYSAVLFALVGWVVRATGLTILLVFPIFWTTVEWMVGHQGDIRFPWLGLGTSLTGYPTVVQIADVIGARGVTFLLALANAALALAWLQRRDRRQVVRLKGGVALGLVVATGYGVVRQGAIELRPIGEVAVLQPNVGYEEKQDSAVWDSIVEDLIELSNRAMDETRPQLVIWPEAAIPYYFDYHPDWETLIAGHARRSGVPIVTGGPDVIWETREDYEYYNSAFLFDSAGRRDAQPVYHKRYLVPIVERVPFLNPRWFDLEWFGGFGVGEPGPVYQVGIGRFGVLICYESAFEDLARGYRRRGADFLVNITNDAWFGKTSAPYQHAAHLVMRAIENRIGIVRAANSGISEFVDPLGREHKRTALDVRTFESDTLMTTDSRTLYLLLGDWVGWICVLSAMILVGYARWQSRTASASAE